MATQETTSAKAAPPGREPPPAPEPTVHLSVPADAVERILAALHAISAGGSSGSTTTFDNRVPSIPQSRTILDYAVVSQLLGRARFTDAVVRASRNHNVITLLDAPAEATGASVLAAGDRDPEVLAFDDNGCTGFTTGGSPTVTLRRIRDDQAITRIEVLDSEGRPLRLGPRLPAQ